MDQDLQGDLQLDLLDPVDQDHQDPVLEDLPDLDLLDRQSHQGEEDHQGDLQLDLQ